jgi:hypothetical protein
MLRALDDSGNGGRGRFHAGATDGIAHDLPAQWPAISSSRSAAGAGGELVAFRLPS